MEKQMKKRGNKKINDIDILKRNAKEKKKKGGKEKIGRPHVDLRSELTHVRLEHSLYYTAVPAGEMGMSVY
jgi:hypothetical protein